jgi:hypothetical protein
MALVSGTVAEVTLPKQTRFPVSSDELKAANDTHRREPSKGGKRRTRSAPAVDAIAATATALSAEFPPSFDAAIARSIEKAESYPEPYRVEVFRLAVSLLFGRRAPTAAQEQLPAASSSQAESSSEDLSLSVQTGLPRLAERLGVLQRDLERAVLLSGDQVSLLGHLDGPTKRELQTKYSLAYCAIKEVALSQPAVSSGELRDLCIAHGCYDVANFAANYKKDVRTGLLREIATRGSNARQYRASKSGLEQGLEILRQMVDE